MTTADEYRVKAGDMAGLAKAETNPFLKAEYERLSLGYLRLAYQAERNSHIDLVYETPPHQAPRQAQQQQQAQPDTKSDDRAGTGS
jgi:hypothetical protein